MGALRVSSNQCFWNDGKLTYSRLNFLDKVQWLWQRFRYIKQAPDCPTADWLYSVFSAQIQGMTEL